MLALTDANTSNGKERTTNNTNHTKKKEEVMRRDPNAQYALAGRIVLDFPLIRADSCHSWFVPFTT